MSAADKKQKARKDDLYTFAAFIEMALEDPAKRQVLVLMIDRWSRKQEGSAGAEVIEFPKR